MLLIITNSFYMHIYIHPYVFTSTYEHMPEYHSICRLVLLLHTRMCNYNLFTKRKKLIKPMFLKATLCYSNEGKKQIDLLLLKYNMMKQTLRERVAYAFSSSLCLLFKCGNLEMNYTQSANIYDFLAGVTFLGGPKCVHLLLAISPAVFTASWVLLLPPRID